MINGTFPNKKVLTFLLQEETGFFYKKTQNVKTIMNKDPLLAVANQCLSCKSFTIFPYSRIGRITGARNAVFFM